MNTDQKHLLSLPRLPARLNVDQAAQFLGFQEHDLPILVAAGLLKPLGRPSPNSTKHFAAVDLEQLSGDVKWLCRATEAVQNHWHRKNRTKVPNSPMSHRRNGRREQGQFTPSPAAVEPSNVQTQ